jgi:DHA3 family macrolide efflux protein-like MFS transporter
MFSVLLLFFAGSIIYVIVVPTVQKTLAWGTSGVGSLAAIGAVGLVLSASMVGIFGNRIDLKNLITGSFIILGVVLFSFPFLNNFWMVAVATFLGGMAISPVFIGQDTLIHHSAEEFLRGRMFSIRDWLYNASFMVFSIIVGMLATFTERNLLFFIFGILLALLAITVRIGISRVQGTSISSNNP